MTDILIKHDGLTLSTEACVSLENAAKALSLAGENVYKPKPTLQERVACVTAVADYLDVCADSHIVQQETPLNSITPKVSEKNYFTETDRNIWKEIASFMRNPQTATGLQKVGALAALAQRADNFHKIYEQNKTNILARNLWSVYNEAGRLLGEQTKSLGTGSLAGVALP
jgi:hypothetical protein